MRINRRVWYLPILLLLLVVAFPGSLWWHARNVNCLKIQNLQDQGFPTNAKELDRYYSIPNGSIDKTKEWIFVIDSIEKRMNEDRFKQLPFVGSDWDVQNTVTPPGIAWPQFESCRKLLREHVQPDLDHLLRIGQQQGEVRLPVSFSEGWNLVDRYTDKYRSVSRWLRLDSRVSAHEGNSKRVLEDIQAEFRWSRHIRREPILISFYRGQALFAVASDEIENWLAYCEWSDQDLERLQVEILSSNFRDELKQAFIGERAMGIDTIADTIVGPSRDSVMAEYMTTMDVAIKSCELAWPGLLRRQERIDARLASLGKKPFAKLQYGYLCELGGAFTQAGVAAARLTARQRCITLLIAAQRFRFRCGRLPTQMDDLRSADFLPSPEDKDLLHDPFTGESMIFRNSEHGVLIYSVAEDLLDNAGLIPSVEPSQPKDLGFLLYRERKVHDLSR